MDSSTGNLSSFANPQTALLDAFFPGFSLVSTALYNYAKIDLSIYIPTILGIAGVLFVSKYVINYLDDFLENHFRSTADIRIDDEMYNMVMAWVAQQGFAKRSRRFVANVNLNSRSWFVWVDNRDEDEEVKSEDGESGEEPKPNKKRALKYTPSFGTHYFWYKGHLFTFKRSQNTQQSYVPISEREEISISSFGRNPAALKELLLECRSNFSKNDENKTLIYRGGLKPGTSEPTWTRCMSRVSRPFSTIVLEEAVKESLLVDIRDYLHPHTRRWYSNRGIPYRRGYLLYGPPGTGKSSLSFAIAGYFNLKIYIVSLNSLAMNEENLGTLFGQLPTTCVVLLEDIDTAGLTHTREKTEEPIEVSKDVSTIPAGTAPGVPTSNSTNGRISLSALLNLLDGVASQEGRILVMTTNHIENLDAALIRPGRVDMKIKFKLASSDMIKTIFKAIFTTLEGDRPPKSSKNISEEKERGSHEKSEVDKKQEEEKRVSALADDFARIIPADEFSPAEIQGYLLTHKRDAEQAVANAAEWVATKKEEKINAKSNEAKAQELLKMTEKEATEDDLKAEEKSSTFGSDTSASQSEISSSGQRSETSTPEVDKERGDEETKLE